MLHHRFSEIAEEIPVSDLARFEECLENEATLPIVETDMRAVEALQAFGTPTIVVNGIYLGAVPSRARLDSLLAAARAER